MGNGNRTDTKAVFAITERGEKSFWTRVGAAFTNRDGSITIQLDALPVSGKLQIRDEEPRGGAGRRTVASHLKPQHAGRASGTSSGVPLFLCAQGSGLPGSHDRAFGTPSRGLLARHRVDRVGERVERRP